MKRLKSIKTNINKKAVAFNKTVRKEIFRLRNNPKESLIAFLKLIRRIIKDNFFEVMFVLTTVIIATMLRWFTINTVNNITNMKPILADFAVALVLVSIGFLVRKKYRFTYFITTSIILSLVCVINSIYYTFYTSYVSVSLIATLEYLFQVTDAVTDNVMKPQDFYYLFAPVVLIITHILIKRKDKKKEKVKEGKTREKKKAATVFIAAVITSLIFMSMLTSLEIGRFTKQWNREYIVMKFGIYTYHLNDLVKSIEPQLTSLFGYDRAMRLFTEYFGDRPEEQVHINEYTGIFEGKNIITIHLESIQSVALGRTFNGKEVTPVLNEIARNSLNFTNFYTQVSVGTSSDTEFTLNTSLMPTNAGTAFVSYFDRYYKSIPSLLKEKGYYSFSMHANNGSYWNRNVMHASLGYDKFYSKRDFTIDEVIGLGLSDKSFFRQSIEYIKEINAKGQPFYGTMIMLTNHTPFSDLEKYGEFPVDIKEERINPETGELEIISYPYMEDTRLGNYFKSTRYADEAIGEFIQALKDEGLMDNTVLVLYGDHDARLPRADFTRLFNYDKETNRNIPSDDPNFVRIDYFKYELLRKVPFMIYSTETRSKLKRDVDYMMGMYDVMPTLGNMFGFYNRYAVGNDIFNIRDNNIVIFPNGNWLTSKMYYNNQNSSFFPLREEVITEEYIKERSTYADRLLKASNALIVFDLIKRSEQQKLANDYVEEKNIEN